jgi:hypothetical protein
MLYDPKWERKTTVAPLLRFIAWLEKQPPRGEYYYALPDECAVAQWLKSEGASNFILTNGQIDRMFGSHKGHQVLNPYDGGDMTYGAALKRARALAAAYSR